jgi:hypothetical protein
VVKELQWRVTLTTRDEVDAVSEAVKERKRKVEQGGHFRRRRRMSLEEKEQHALGNSAMTIANEKLFHFSMLDAKFAYLVRGRNNGLTPSVLPRTKPTRLV